MRKFRKSVSLLMMSAMLILPTAIPVQAEETDNNTTANVESVVARASYSYTSPANTTASDVCLRRTASTSGEIMLLLKKGASLMVDEANALKRDSIWWYPCKYTSGGNTYYGFVAAQYVHVIPT